MRKGFKLTLMICLAGAAVSLAVSSYMAYRHTGSFVPEVVQRVIEKHGGNGSDQAYILDCAYDGSVNIDKRVFDYPFQKTGNYIRNKDFLSIYGFTYAARSKEAAKTFVDKLYGSGFRAIEADQDLFVEELSGLLADAEYFTDAGELLTTGEVAEAWADYIVEHKSQSSTSFVSADFLVFSDGMIYVRGILTVTSYRFDDPEPSPLIAEDIPLFKDGTYIVDIGLSPYINNSASSTDEIYGYKAASIEVIKDITEE